MLDSPAVWDTPKTHFFLTPSRILGYELHSLGVDSLAGRTLAKAENGTYERNTHYINCFGNSIRKSIHEVVSPADHFSWAMGTTKLCAAHPDTPTPSDCLLVHAAEGKNGQNESLQMASEHA